MEQKNNSLPTRLERMVIYESRWVNLYRDRVALPNGHVFEQYHILDFGRGSVAVVVENEHGEILLERITRYPTGTTTWELPTGGIEGDESVIAAAEREVLEETGYQTHGHTESYRYHPLNGISDMQVHVVHCRAGTRCGQVDENEVEAIGWFSPQDLHSMIERREITDGFALIGLLLQSVDKLRSNPGGIVRGSDQKFEFQSSHE